MARHGRERLDRRDSRRRHRSRSRGDERRRRKSRRRHSSDDSGTSSDDDRRERRRSHEKTDRKDGRRREKERPRHDRQNGGTVTDRSTEPDPLDVFMEQVIDPQVQEQARRAVGEIEEETEEAGRANTSTAMEDKVDAMAESILRGKEKKEMILEDPSTFPHEEFRKNLYVETAEIGAMTEEEVRLLRLDLDGIKIRGLSCPKPVKKWSQCGLSLRILDELSAAGLEKPTPIQAQAMPAIMGGRDVIGVAKTGSGKTLAFLLPMLRHVADQREPSPHEGPIALVLTPTRELAVQTTLVCRQYSRPLGLRVACAYGGSAIKSQISELRQSPEIVVGTPGRLLDLLCASSGRITNLRRVTFLVLDEADRMFDMGFEPQVMRIIGGTRPDRQTVLFSATFPRAMEALARRVLSKPLEIVIGGRSVVCSDVTQTVRVVDSEHKFLQLLEILGQWYPSQAERILIFVDRQDAADYLFRDLTRKGYVCISLHGGKDQADRVSHIADFERGDVPIMIATSVAARGLDIRDLQLVINYECPNHLEDYVHRVGRTGRAGRKGTAITFITTEQARYAPEIVRALKDSGTVVPDDLQQLASDFLAKVKSGEERRPGTGFSGKGLEKIDQERELLKKAQKISFGEADEEEVQDLSKEAEGKTERKVSAAGADGEAAPAHEKGGFHASVRAAQELAARLGGALSTATKDALSMVNMRFQAGVGVSSEGDAIYTFQTADGFNAFCAELEINDYPQIARWKVTSRDVLAQISDLCNASLLVRGSFYPPGKPVAAGDRKLYVRIEAESHGAVDYARKEIKRVVCDTVSEQSVGVADKGKYTVV